MRKRNETANGEVNRQPNGIHFSRGGLIRILYIIIFFLFLAIVAKIRVIQSFINLFRDRAWKDEPIFIDMCMQTRISSFDAGIKIIAWKSA